MNSPTAIEILDLTRCFGELTALDHISLRVGSGQIFGLLGPNGSGKSTTIKILTTLLKPSAGTARVADFDIMEHPAQVRAHIGYVPQALSADGALTGHENLLLSARLYGVPKEQRNERIQTILQFMQLADAAGGMIRRLELAQAMLHRPAVLFLDEPTIGLDPVARFLVWEHLKDLRNTFKMTVLITTHDMEEADVLCDELAFLHQGKIVGQGKPAELKQSLGPAADLNDVFTHFSGSSFVEGGKFSDVRQTRYTAGRHG